MQNTFNHIYGPVSSWRFGSSLGIDLLPPGKKICNFNCIYCQLGKGKGYTNERKLYIPTEDIISEVKRLPKIHFDCITFSGNGEPTLAINLGEAIKAIKKIRNEPVCVLTNGVLIGREDVMRELSLADIVSVKLDSFSEGALQKINKPAKGIRFRNIIKGIKNFRKHYKGKLALQIMFIDKNKAGVKQIETEARKINPDTIQINTPIRPSPVAPLPPELINCIKKQFNNFNLVSVYDSAHKKIKPISKKNTLKRRGDI